MRPFEGVSDETGGVRFHWLLDTAYNDFDSGANRKAKEFYDFYVHYNGGIYESMQAALDTNTPYAKDLSLRLLTAILEGKVP